MHLQCLAVRDNRADIDRKTRMTVVDNSRPGSLGALHDILAAEIGADNISADALVAQAHAGDWSDIEKCAPPLVLFPRQPQQVAAVMKLLAAHGQRVVIQGGLTGLAGAATPQPGEVALSLAKMNRIEEFDRVGGTITVQAGVTLEQVQKHVEAEGWFFPLDLGARGSCQIGGNVATNAGGNRVVRYGTMRQLVLGIEVVLADGTLLTMLNKVTKNNTGIDLRQMFIGAEGTLGVITRVVLKLSPKPAAAVTALCALSSFADATRLMTLLQRQLPTLSAFEVMWGNFMDAGMAIASLRPPFPARYPVYVIVETLGASDEEERRLLEAALELALEENVAQDVAVAQSMEHARQLWQYRESIGELLAKIKPHAAFDVGIPMTEMDGFVTSVERSLKALFPQQQHLFFGHIGDGNLHVLSGPYADPALLHRVEEVVYRAATEAGGNISAEHGIGMVKKEFLHLSRSVEELALMRSLKRMLDPARLLNDGRVF
jgi:FAD/FMN-containing dehydrogenase